MVLPSDVFSEFVDVKLLSSDAVMPSYAHVGDAGFDLYSVSDVLVQPGLVELVHTGLSFSIPEGYEIQIRPRSSTGLKTPLIIPNSPGTIDSGYTGEVCIIVKNIGTETYIIKKHDKIAQGVLAPVYMAIFNQVDAMPQTERGDNGFGSTN